MTRGQGIRFDRRAGLMAGAAALILWATPLAAQERQRFNLPAGNAAQAVQKLAIEAGIQVMAPNADLEGITTNPVNGDYTPAEALRRMLADKGLEVTSNGDTIVIRRADSAAATSSDSASAPEIIVTGSRIPRPGFDTLEAAIVTDAEQFRRRGYTNAIEALNDTPGFVRSSVNQIGTNQGTFSAGQNFADFFGLGSQRTLTLVNGRRFVSSNTVASGGQAGQQVDLNVIPAGLIERVETVAIGGAPIYGSDAIAGTVNVILKDNFEGLSLTLQSGIAERGDAENYTIRGLGGINFAEGRGNIAIGAEYNTQSRLVLRDRTGVATTYNNPAAPPSFLLTDDAVLRGVTYGGLPFRPGFGSIVDASGVAQQFADGGNLVPFITGPRVSGAFHEGGDGIRFADFQSLLSPTERLILSGIAHYDLMPGVRLFNETSYSRSTGKEISELAALASPFLVGNFASISIDNPFLSPAARATLVANGVTTTFPLARDFLDIVARDGSLTENMIEVFRTVVGLKGNLTLFGQPAGWDVSLNYGRSRGRMDTTYIDNTRFIEAINATRNASGQIVCASGNAACVPINLFGRNSVTDAAAAYVTDDGGATSVNTQKVATANFNGALPFRISSEPIAFNIGAEYRKESGRFDPDPLLRRTHLVLGAPLASPYTPQSGSFDTKEVYGELSVPLISSDQDIPVVKSLSAQGAMRYVHNSINGGDITWSAGGRFSPRLPGVLDGLTFRGVYTQAIRAPAITELFSGSSPTRGGIADPCAFNRFQTGANATVRAANCTAALQAITGANAPATFAPTTLVLSPIGTISGNPNLENETAKSWSAGVVYQPTEIPGLRIAADWSQIKLTNGIQSLSIGRLINTCYDSPAFPTTPACGQFRRLAASEVGPGTANPTRVAGDIADGYSSGFVNTSSFDFAGLIISAEYALDLQRLLNTSGKPGTIGFGAKVFHNSKYVQLVADSDPVVDAVGGVGLPKWSGQFNVNYAGEHFLGSLQALWTGAVKRDILATAAQLRPEDNEIGDYWRFNGSLGYRINERFRFQVVVNNLFDRKPTRAAIASSSFGTYDLIGRSYRFTANVDF